MSCDHELANEWARYSWENADYVVVRLFSNRSQMTLKCGKNKKVVHEAYPSVSLMFLPHGNIESIYFI